MNVTVLDLVLMSQIAKGFSTLLIAAEQKVPQASLFSLFCHYLSWGFFRGGNKQNYTNFYSLVCFGNGKERTVRKWIPIFSRYFSIPNELECIIRVSVLTRCRGTVTNLSVSVIRNSKASNLPQF